MYVSRRLYILQLNSTLFAHRAKGTAPSFFPSSKIIRSHSWRRFPRNETRTFPFLLLIAICNFHPRTFCVINAMLQPTSETSRPRIAQVFIAAERVGASARKSTSARNVTPKIYYSTRLTKVITFAMRCK